VTYYCESRTMHGWLGNVDRLVRQVGYVPDTPEDMEIRQMEIDGPEALLSMPAFRSLNPTQGCFERKLFFLNFFYDLLHMRVN